MTLTIRFDGAVRLLLEHAAAGDPLLARLDALSAQLQIVQAQGAAMATAQERMQEALDRLNETATNLGNALKTAVEQLQRDDLTEEQEAAAIARINQISDYMVNVLGTNPENPVPDPPAEEPTEQPEPEEPGSGGDEV